MKIGTLYIIATPIGNLEDFTFRAVRILKECVDVVYCEDTRQSLKLLNHYNISIPARSLHAHSPDSKIERIIGLLCEGSSVAYITDSGTPAISDPGSRLVERARRSGIPVTPIPGPTALAALASVSGFQGKNIIFAGFTAKKESKQRRELLKLKEFDGMIVLYESPYRIKKLIGVIGEVFPDSMVLIGREMTKVYEEFLYSSSSEMLQHVEEITEKGEFTVAIVNELKKEKKIHKNTQKFNYAEESDDD